MPPRFAYWTILIDNAPTAFRARDAEDLLPTLNQLKRKNPNVVLKWFSGGRLWASPEAAREARRRPPAATEKRGAGWRPGGAHRDPRDRFKKKPHGERPRTDQPWTGKDRAWSGKPASPRRPRQDRTEWRDRANTPRMSGQKFGQTGRAPKPWRDRPAPSDRRPFRPRGPGAPRSTPFNSERPGRPRKKDEEPPDRH